jgi:hypothetical protein
LDLRGAKHRVNERWPLEERGSLTISGATLLAKSLGSCCATFDGASLESREVGIGSTGADGTAGMGHSGIVSLELAANFLRGVAGVGDNEGGERQRGD